MAKKSVTCQIIKIETNPKGGQNVFVECSIGNRKWILERWLNYKRPISMEQFIKAFAKTDVIPSKPTDFLAFVKEEADKPFIIEVDDKK